VRIGIDASRTFVPNPTGTERYAGEVTLRLLAIPESGDHTWILYARKVNFQAINSKFEKRLNVKVVEIKLPFLWTQMGMAARTWIDNLDILWVPAHTLPIMRKPGIKTIVTIHGLEYEWLPAYENFLQRWYLPLSTIYASKSADKIIAVSKFTSHQLVNRLGIPGEKIKVIYEGFTSQPPGKHQESLFEKYGIKPKKYLMFVGTIQPRKNLIRLIEAFSNLNNDFKLVICGKWGWLYEEIQAAPEKFGISDRTVFTGYINDADRVVLLANALVYVQPSITEGFGLPVLEAMEKGIPVVSSRGGALQEIVRGAGLLFDPYNTADIELKIKQVLRSEKLRKLLRARGKRRVLDFSWEKAAYETYNYMIHYS